MKFWKENQGTVKVMVGQINELKGEVLYLTGIIQVISGVLKQHDGILDRLGVQRRHLGQRAAHDARCCCALP